MKKRFYCMISAVILLSLLNLSCSNEERPVLSIYNWGDYIDETVISQFEEEYDAKVIYNLYSTNEELYVKLKQGSDEYDIACPSDYMLERMAKEGMLEKLDHSLLPNMEGIDAEFLDLPFDKGNSYSIPYMWGTLGILYNSDVIQEAPKSWAILWDRKYEKRIGMYNSVRDSFVPPLKLLGYSLNTQIQEELEEAKQLLISQKELVLVYGEDILKEMVTGNEIDMALVYSGDYGWVAEDFPNMGYVVPEEGSNIWFDNWVILKNSDQKELAHEFLNFICREDIALKNADYIGYASPFSGVIEKLEPEIRNDIAIYPQKEIIENCEVFSDLGGETNRVLDKMWTEIKASK